MFPQFNETALNISSVGGLTPFEAKQYVTIESCKFAFAQANFWVVILGVLLIILTGITAYLLKFYLKNRK